jgi:four helix bundle protein
MFRFEDLEIWRMAIDYGDKLYRVSYTFPKEGRFALSDQLRRSAVSISNNIAEGSCGTSKEFSYFLNTAIRSTLETVSILYFAKRQGYLDEQERVILYNEAELLIKKIRAFKNKLF